MTPHLDGAQVFTALVHGSAHEVKRQAPQGKRHGLLPQLIIAWGRGGARRGRDGGSEGRREGGRQGGRYQHRATKKCGEGVGGANETSQGLRGLSTQAEEPHRHQSRNTRLIHDMESAAGVERGNPSGVQRAALEQAPATA